MLKVIFKKSAVEKYINDSLASDGSRGVRLVHFYGEFSEIQYYISSQSLQNIHICDHSECIRVFKIIKSSMRV